MRRVKISAINIFWLLKWNIPEIPFRKLTRMKNSGAFYRTQSPDDKQTAFGCTDTTFISSSSFIGVSNSSVTLSSLIVLQSLIEMICTSGGFKMPGPEELQSRSLTIFGIVYEFCVLLSHDLFNTVPLRVWAERRFCRLEVNWSCKPVK